MTLTTLSPCLTFWLGPSCPFTMTATPEGQEVRRHVGEPVDTPPVGMIFIRLSKSAKVKNRLRLNKKSCLKEGKKGVERRRGRKRRGRAFLRGWCCVWLARWSSSAPEPWKMLRASCCADQEADSAS